MNINRKELVQTFAYLDDLRRSCRVNMFASAANMMDDLRYPRNKSCRLVSLWMRTFGDGTSTVEHRAEAALAMEEDKP